MIQTLADALAARGYDSLTPVQEAVTRPDLADADLLVSAQTGSGKTVGFGLAIAGTLLGDAPGLSPAGAPLALVIAPTRELALQVKRELGWLYAQAGAVMASCVGGMDMRDERRALDRGAHIVVATPGRLRDHIERGSLDPSALRAVVLDEADEMLDLGFREDLEMILAACPVARRTLMFSATVPRGIATLAATYQRDAVRLTVTAPEGQHADIAYRALTVADREVDGALINVLRYYESPNAIVFCRTRAEVTRLATRLANRGFATVALSGELSQADRAQALQSMRDGRARVCVATDVAARGIDLPNLDLVLHADLPTNPDTLLHRSGRTGRAGRKGTSVVIVPAKARRKAERLLAGAGITAEWGTPPDAEAVRARDAERLLADPALSEPVTGDEAALVARITAAHAPEQIAAALLRRVRAAQSAPEDLSPPDTPRATRPAFGPSVWFRLSIGRDDRAEARWILPMLCRAGGLSREDIGAIRVQQSETLVEIAAPRAAALEQAVGADGTLDGGARLTRQADATPAATPAAPAPPPPTPQAPAAPRTATAEPPAPPPPPVGDPAPAPSVSDPAPPPRTARSHPAPAAPAAKPDGKAKPRHKPAGNRNGTGTPRQPDATTPPPTGSAKRAARPADGPAPRKARPFGGKPDGNPGTGKPRHPGKPGGGPSGTGKQATDRSGTGRPGPGKPRPAGKPGRSKPPAPPPANAADPSARFVPPGHTDPRPPRKPAGARRPTGGGNAPPRRAPAGKPRGKPTGPGGDRRG